MRRKIVDSLVTDLEDSGEFKKVYRNIVPVWSQVKSLPAVAVIYEQEKKDPDNITNKACYYIGIVNIYVYNKQPKTKYDDILSDLIDIVYKVVQENDVLCNYVISAEVAEMKRDGGIAHPYSIAQIQVEVRYKLSL
jgi:beta-mannanase